VTPVGRYHESIDTQSDNMNVQLTIMPVDQCEPSIFAIEETQLLQLGALVDHVVSLSSDTVSTPLLVDNCRLVVLNSKLVIDC